MLTYGVRAAVPSSIALLLRMQSKSFQQNRKCALFILFVFFVWTTAMMMDDDRGNCQRVAKDTDVRDKSIRLEIASCQFQLPQNLHWSELISQNQNYLQKIIRCSPIVNGSSEKDTHTLVNNIIGGTPFWNFKFFIKNLIVVSGHSYATFERKPKRRVFKIV